jgi:hypothetical protein
MKVFISHSSQDKRFVRTLKNDLNENGIETFFDEDSLELGDSLKERLDIALDESSHFVIILSQNSVRSNWVKYELIGATKLFDSKTLKKIIPIKYRECEVPESIAGLLYADLSNENVRRNDDQVKFLGDGYEKFLNQLINTIKNSERRLNKTDKTELKKEVNETEKKNEKVLSQTFQIRHKIVRFKDGISLKFYQDKISKIKKGIAPNNFLPVILPPYYKVLMGDLKIGEEIQFSKDGLKAMKGNFAGFRNSDIGITLHPALRKFLEVEPGLEISFIVTISSRLFVKS